MNVVEEPMLRKEESIRCAARASASIATPPQRPANFRVTFDVSPNAARAGIQRDEFIS